MVARPEERLLRLERAELRIIDPNSPTAAMRDASTDARAIWRRSRRAAGCLSARMGNI